MGVRCGLCFLEGWRRVSELGESLDEDLVVRFLVTMWEIPERQRTLLATQGINIPNARALGIDVLFFNALMGNCLPRERLPS